MIALVSAGLLAGVGLGPSRMVRRVAGINSGGAALQRLARLPVQAQSVISSTVGATERTFVARRIAGGYRLDGGGVLGLLDGRGADLRASGGSLSLVLAGAGRGGRLTLPRVGSLTARSNRVVSDLGNVREWYVAGPLGIEQGFTLARRPAGSGPVTLVLRLGGSLRARRSKDGLVFVNGLGRAVLRYGGLSASDAAGRQLKASLVLRGGVLRLRIVDHGARYPLTVDPFVQQGSRLIGDCLVGCSDSNGRGETGGGIFGSSVALSANGSTVLVGAPFDNGDAGAAWVFTQSGGAWSQQGSKLVANCTTTCSGPNGTGESGNGWFGVSVALSADGSTALIGAFADNSNAGAAWIFTRSGGGWSQQGTKLVGTCTAPCGFGDSVALSADGSVALIGAPAEDSSAGAAWAFTQSGGVWHQPGTKLIADCTAGCVGPNGTGESGSGDFGWSVALSANGSTALIGALYDDSSAGAAWVFTQSGGVWSQQGGKLVGSCTANSCIGPNGTGESGNGLFGNSVALSADGSTALIGAPSDSSVGAAWVFTQSGGVWSQQGGKLVGSCTANSCIGPNGTGESGNGQFGYSVALSAGGSTALIGAFEDSNAGAAWIFTRSGGVWSQQGSKFVGNCVGTCTGPNGTGETGNALFGSSVALSTDGTTALIGAPADSGEAGAAWVFVAPPSCTNVSASTPAGGGPVAVSLSCSSLPSAPPSYTVVSGPLHGSLGAIDPSTGTVLYTPQPGFFGSDTFTYHALDSVGGSNLATVTITVPPAPPSCSGVSASAPVGGGTVGLSLNCTAPAGAPITYAIVSGPSHGTIGVLNPDTGAVSYTSAPGYFGSDSFTYLASDAGGTSNTASVEITISPQPPPPPPPPPAPPAASIRVPSGGKVDLTATRGAVLGALTIACTGVVGQVCAGHSLFTVNEQRRGTTTVGLGANTRERRPKPRPTNVVVTVASASYAIAAGQTATVSVVFNTAGKRLLAQFYTLPTTLSSSGSAITPLAITFAYPVVTGPPNSSWDTFTWRNKPCSFCWTSVNTSFFFGVPRLLATATVRVTCEGASCPRPRTFGPRLHTLKLNGMFAGRKLGPHSTVSVLITAPDTVGRLITWKTIAGSPPVLTVKCLPPGAPRPTACPAGV